MRMPLAVSMLPRNEHVSLIVASDKPGSMLTVTNGSRPSERSFSKAASRLTCVPLAMLLPVSSSSRNSASADPAFVVVGPGTIFSTRLATRFFPSLSLLEQVTLIREL